MEGGAESRLKQSFLQPISDTHPFAKFILTKRERPPMVIFQLDMVYNWSNKLPQKSMDEISSPSIIHRSPLSFISHKTINV
jgi:hypothetical protein